MQKLILGLLCIAIHISGWCQDNNALTKEIINQEQINLQDTTEWKNSNKRFYSYNSKRLPVYGQYQNWDPEIDAWGPVMTQWEYDYDKSGNRIYDRVVRYGEDGEITMKRELTRNFRGDLILRSKRIFTDINENLHEEFIVDYKYDSRDRLTRQIQEYQDNYNIHTKLTNYNYYNDDGCRFAEVKSDITYFIDRSYELRDSTYRHFTADCELRQIDFYSYEGQLNKYQLTYQYRIDEEYDEWGYTSKEMYYDRNNKNEEWNHFATLEYENNADGKRLITFLHNLENGYKSILTNEYDENGQIIHELKEEWNPEINDFQKSYDIQSTYHLDSILNFIIYQYGWNNTSESFDFFFSASYEFDENNYVVRKIESEQKLNNNNGEKYLISVETLYNNRCDGEVISWFSSEIESDNAPYHYTGNKTIRHYYENALCDPGVFEENEVVIYPNPSRGDINVYNADTYGESSIQVMNYKGQVVYQDRTFLNNYFSFNLEGLPSGMYILNIDNGIIQTSKKFMLVNQ